MLVFIAEILILVLLYQLTNRIGKLRYCFWTAILLAFFAAMRSSSVGPDGHVYARYFEELHELSYADIFQKFDKEPIFYVITKWLQQIGVSLQGWYAIIGSCFAFSIMFMVRQYSKQPMISVLALFSLGYYAFSFTGLRQTVALSIIIVSFSYIERRRYIHSVLLIMLAAVFHNTALVFGLVFFLRDKKIRIWQYLLVVLLSLCAVVFFKPQVYALISETVEHIERLEGYAGYTYGLSWAGFIIQSMIFILCLLAYNGEDKHIFLNVSFLGVLFQILTVMMAEFFRVSMYFNVFNIVLIGNIFCQNRFSISSKKIVKLAILVVLILYFVNSHLGYEYKFYWQ